MDVWEYFESKRREILGAALRDDELRYMEELGSEGQRGRIWGRLGFSERSFLQVSERVEVVGTGIHRTEYAYFLILDGTELWGTERDPTHEPAVHMHDRDHNREPCEPVSFKEALDRAWKTVSEEDSWEPLHPQA